MVPTTAVRRVKAVRFPIAIGKNIIKDTKGRVISNSAITRVTLVYVLHHLPTTELYLS